MPQPGLRVVVVSSRPSVAAGLQRQLHSSPIAVVAAPESDAFRHAKEYCIAAFVVDASEPRPELVGTVARLHRSNRGIPIIVLCQVRQEMGCFIASTIQAGATGIAIQELDELAGIVDRAICRSVVSQHADALCCSVRQFAPLILCIPLTTFFEGATEGRNVNDVARILGVDRRTLAQRFAAANWPSPGFVFSWFKLMLAIRLFDHSSMSVSEVAGRLGYSSAPRLRELSRRMAHLSLAEARAIGSEALFEVFRTRMSRFSLHDESRSPLVPLSGNLAEPMIKPVSRFTIA
jgi:AraC-like DNA-binding protein